MRGLAAVLLCCLALAACGRSEPSPSQLLARAEQGFEGVRSYHVSGGLFVNQTRVVISADVLADGDATGTITVVSQTTHFIVAHGVNYFETLETNIIGPVDPTLLSLLAALRANIP